MKYRGVFVNIRHEPYVNFFASYAEYLPKWCRERGESLYHVEAGQLGQLQLMLVVHEEYAVAPAVLGIV